MDVGLSVALMSEKEKFEVSSSYSIGKHPNLPRPFFSCVFIQVKSIKVSLLALSSRLRALKPSYSNINARKAFSLFLVSNLYDHALTLDHTQDPYKHEILKNSVLGMNKLS